MICLVGPATDTDLEESSLLKREDSASAPRDFPLGILTLAAMLRHHAVTPAVVDLNLWYCEYIRSPETRRGSSFDMYAARRLASQDVYLFGMGTICSSYPLSIQIAHQLKRLRPNASILMGGPQASVVDLCSLQHFPYIDFILRGEADQSLPELVDCLASGRSLSTVPGLTYRCNGQVRRNADAPAMQDLDLLPLPAFDLYPGMTRSRAIPLEHGRGCPFSCQFCSTNDFFRRRFRLKSPARLIQEMDTLAERYGASYFDLMHDMFTVDRRRVVEFCDAMLKSGRPYQWGCSARTDCVDEELLELMANAGCVSIFFGVESGSPRMQKIMSKGLDIDEALRNVRAACRNRMTTVTSMIVGFPEETRADLESTLSFIADAMRDKEVDPHLHLLAPLAGTPLQLRHRNELLLPEIYTDMSHNRLTQDPDERRLIGQYPDVFPNFYSIPTAYLDLHYLQELREFIVRLISRFRWMVVAWYARCGSVLSLFDEWREWRDRNSARVPQQGQIRGYHCNWQFDGDFIAFLSDRAGARSEFETVLLNFEQELMSSLRISGSNYSSAGPVEAIEGNMRLVREDQVFVLGLRGNVRLVADLLAAKEGPSPRIHEPSIVATRLTADGNAEVLEITSAMADFLALCDGETSVGDVLERFAAKCGSAGKLSSMGVAVYGLTKLYAMKLVRVLPPVQVVQYEPALWDSEPHRVLTASPRHVQTNSASSDEN